MRRLATLVALAATACGAPEALPEAPALEITEVLAGDSTGFARADAPRDFSFPRDHGSHPDFRTEWWYYTGHLQSDDARDFGFQLTFFRSALGSSNAPVALRSAWRADNLWMGHLAVGDYAANRFWPFERFARGAAGLAGARSDGLGVWLEDWQATAHRPAERSSSVQLRAHADGVGIDLIVEPVVEPLLQGNAGLSQKGEAAGNASYYYSVTRWRARGSVTLPGEVVPVTGTAWLDREWSSSALESGQVGWDWFSLQLAGGSDLMLYVMRRADGTVDRHSSGTWRSTTGEIVRLSADAFDLTATSTWLAPSEVRYPATWQLRIPELDLELAITPRMADQELRLAFRYWEGGVDARGTRAGEAIDGKGFAELTGYGATPDRP